MKRQLHKTLTNLILEHQGRPAVILGGAPSLPEDFKQAPRDAVLISANGHGCMLTKCDYMVCIDSKEKFFKSFNTPIIAPRRWADYRIFDRPIANSAATAAWAAWAMGCAPIIIMGVSMYQGGTYWHDEKANTTGVHLSLKGHMQRWNMLNKYPHIEVRAVSGAPLELFRKYDPDEPIYRVPDRGVIRSYVAGIMVEFTQDFDELGPHRYKMGDVDEVHVNDLKEYPEYMREIK